MEKSFNSIIEVLETMERTTFKLGSYLCIRDVLIPNYLNHYKGEYLAIIAEEDKYYNRIFITLFHNDEEYKYECKKEQAGK